VPRRPDLEPAQVDLDGSSSEAPSSATRIQHTGTGARRAVVADGRIVADEVVEAAAVGFAAAAGSYARGRPSYPAGVVERFLSTAAVGTHDVVVDVGAGSGQMTALLVGRGVRTIATDPVVEMLGMATGRWPRLVATAQGLPLRTGSVTAVMVANAFHWFATAGALAELHRCLRPGGTLALVWNERDERVDWVRRQSEIVDAHQGDAPRFKTMDWKAVVDGHPAFTELEASETANPTAMTRARLVDRVLSTSFIASLPDRPRRRVEAQATELAASLPETFDYPYVTRMWLYRRDGERGGQGSARPT
jgi:SAM-dependent methyltransferase